LVAEVVEANEDHGHAVRAIQREAGVGILKENEAGRGIAELLRGQNVSEAMLRG